MSFDSETLCTCFGRTLHHFIHIFPLFISISFICRCWNSFFFLPFFGISILLEELILVPKGIINLFLFFFQREMKSCVNLFNQIRLHTSSNRYLYRHTMWPWPKCTWVSVFIIVILFRMGKKVRSFLACH